MENAIEQILKDAIHAPSGDNSQPWKFLVNGSTIELSNLPEKDNPIFNYKQRGSFIAHGAVLENIGQLAPLYGYKAETILFPQGPESQVVAKVTFVPGSRNENKDIIDIIKKRCTNRKKYVNINLEQLLKNKLFALSDSGKILIKDEKKDKITLGQSASTAEKIMLGYKPLHDAFFSMIRWTREQEQEKRGGLFIGTLELLPPQKLIFKWFSNWGAAAILRKIGFPSLIAKENAKTYASSGAFGAIVMPSQEPKDFVETGMLLQRIWLKITGLGLSLQPVAGVLYLEQRVKEKTIEDLDSDSKMLILNSVKNIYKTFDNPKGFITMMFRLGQAEQPSARSLKFFPN